MVLHSYKPALRPSHGLVVQRRSREKEADHHTTPSQDFWKLTQVKYHPRESVHGVFLTENVCQQEHNFLF